MPNSRDAYEMLAKLRQTLTTAQAQVSDLAALLNELHLPQVPRAECPRCALTFGSSRVRDEHLYLAHEGPEPFHWAEAEARTEQSG